MAATLFLVWKSLTSRFQSRGCITELPITPERVLKALEEQRSEG